jgi:predicted nucleotidyltransferase
MVRAFTRWYRMRLNHPLDGLLFSRTSTRVLRELCLYPNRQLTSNEVARAAGAPTHRVLEVLRRFELEGVVSSRVVGSAYWWTVKGTHPLVRAAADLFRSERRVTERLEKLVGGGLAASGAVERVVLFGSAARRQEEASSDVDLLVVVPEARDRTRIEAPLRALRERAREEFGTRVRPLVYTRAQYARKRGKPLIENIEREGVVLVPAKE